MIMLDAAQNGPEPGLCRVGGLINASYPDPSDSLQLRRLVYHLGLSTLESVSSSRLFVSLVQPPKHSAPRYSSAIDKTSEIHATTTTLAYRPEKVVSSIRDLEFETPLNTWVRSDDRRDLAGRLAAATYQLPPHGGIVNKYDSMYPRSTGQRTSIAVHARSEAPSTTASDNVPRLTRGNSNASSVGSADTDIASSLDGMRRLESVDGVLQVPVPAHPHADLICPFQILDCEEPFNDVVEWKTHVFSHFRGRPLPVTATCFLCESTFDQSRDDDEARAWNEMLSHMAAVHFRGLGQRLATVRTNFALMRWMYTRRIITAAQFTRTQSMPLPTVLPGTSSEIVNMPMAPPPPPPPPPPPSASAPVGQDAAYTVHASSRRESRRRSNRPRPPRN